MTSSLDVSRETNDLLSRYVDLVAKWNPKINLVSKLSLDEVWERHINDSVQLFPLANRTGNWLDLGSGGGFPGIVVAIMDQHLNNRFSVTLVESDTRKCAFLRTAVRELDLSVEVVNERIENIGPQKASVISARALTDLRGLIAFSQPHLQPDGICLFPKGQSWYEEVETARKDWKFDYEAVASATDPDAAIIKMEHIQSA